MAPARPFTADTPPDLSKYELLVLEIVMTGLRLSDNQPQEMKERAKPITLASNACSSLTSLILSGAAWRRCSERLCASVLRPRQISLPLCQNPAKYISDELLRTRFAYLVFSQWGRRVGCLLFPLPAVVHKNSIEMSNLAHLTKS